MRFFLRLPFIFASIAVLITTGLSSPSDVKEGGITIARVFTGWKEGSSFKRISEYFTGKENTGGIIVLRTHADQRSGFYFFVRAANSGAPTAVKINVELIAPTDNKPKTHSFSADLKSGQNLLDLGLTADDWPDAKANPVAWKI